jgi:rubrerythrin
MTIQEKLQKRYLEKLVSTPRGRGHVLSICVEGESNGEGQVFERALARVDDPSVARMIKRHQEDEILHTRLFQERLDAQGVAVPPVPDHLKLIDRLDAALGNVIDRTIETREDIMHMYLVLQVIEERAITQFGEIGPAFAAVDPETAETFARVAKDEERHLKYCHAIARRFAPDAVTHDRELARYRAVESRVFAQTTRDNMAWSLANGVVDFGFLGNLFWRGLRTLNSRSQPTMPTPYWHDHALAAA